MSRQRHFVGGLINNKQSQTSVKFYVQSFWQMFPPVSFINYWYIFLFVCYLEHWQLMVTISGCLILKVSYLECMLTLRRCHLTGQPFTWDKVKLVNRLMLNLNFIQLELGMRSQLNATYEILKVTLSLIQPRTP